jgi:LmbE family N-acetylglucosaminyl deacetylase
VPLFGFHPRAWLDRLLTYPRFLGSIKPQLVRADDDEFAARLSLYQSGWWPKRLEPPLAKRILAISPHPDDEAIGCGGLLLAHAGHAEIQIVNVYNGDGGGALAEGPWRDDLDYKKRLVEVRARELDAAAAALGANRVTRLNVSDCDGQPGEAEIAKLRDILHSFKPDLVVLPWLLDRHAHHRRTNEIFAAAVAGIDTMVIGYEIWALLTPNAYLDITDHLDRKLEIVALYESQLRTVDYREYARGLAQTRAFHSPVRDKRVGAVEAYVALPSRDYCDLVTGRGVHRGASPE